MGLDSLLENENEDLAHKTVVLCGYGSGSHAVIQANLIKDQYKQVTRKLDLMRRLNSRRKLSIDEYERIHKGLIAPNDWPTAPGKRFLLRSIGEKETPAEGDCEYVLYQ